MFEDAGKLIALLVSLLALLNGVYDFYLKIKKKNRLWGSRSDLIVRVSWILFLIIGGYFLGVYREFILKQPLIEKLIQEKDRTHKQKEELNASFQSIMNRSARKINEQERAIQNLQESCNEINNEISEEHGRLVGCILYSEPQYQGNPLFFKDGEYSSLHDFGFGDKVRSIRLLGHVRITVWEDVGYQGFRRRIEADTPVLPVELDSKMSSMRIEVLQQE